MKYEIEPAVGYVADTQPDLYARVGFELVDDERIGSFEKALFLLLARHANFTSGMAFPGYRRIRKKLRCSYGSITDGLKILSTLGYLTITATRGKRSLYALRMPVLLRSSGVLPTGSGSATHAVAERDTSNERVLTRSEQRLLPHRQKKPPRKEKYVLLNGLTQEVMDGIVTRRGG